MTAPRIYDAGCKGISTLIVAVAWFPPESKRTVQLEHALPPINQPQTLEISQSGRVAKHRHQQKRNGEHDCRIA